MQYQFQLLVAFTQAQWLLGAAITAGMEAIRSVRERHKLLNISPETSIASLSQSIYGGEHANRSGTGNISSRRRRNPH